MQFIISEDIVDRKKRSFSASVDGVMRTVLKGMRVSEHESALIDACKGGLSVAEYVVALVVKDGARKGVCTKKGALK